MSNFSDNELQFNVELLDALKTAQLDIAKSGAVKHFQKGNFKAEYRSPDEIQKTINQLSTTISIQKNGCKVHMGGLRCR